MQRRLELHLHLSGGQVFQSVLEITRAATKDPL